jgi:hypothetical protein
VALLQLGVLEGKQERVPVRAREPGGGDALQLVHCTALPVQCSAVQYNAVRCTALHAPDGGDTLLPSPTGPRQAPSGAGVSTAGRWCDFCRMRQNCGQYRIAALKMQDSKASLLGICARTHLETLSAPATRFFSPPWKEQDKLGCTVQCSAVQCSLLPVLHPCGGHGEAGVARAPNLKPLITNMSASRPCSYRSKMAPTRQPPAPLAADEATSGRRRVAGSFRTGRRIMSKYRQGQSLIDNQTPRIPVVLRSSVRPPPPKSS